MAAKSGDFLSFQTLIEGLARELNACLNLLADSPGPRHLTSYFILLDAIIKDERAIVLACGLAVL